MIFEQSMSSQKVPLLQAQNCAQFLEKLLLFSLGWWEWGGVVHPGKWPPRFGKIKETPPLVAGLQHTPEMGCVVHYVYIFRAAREKDMDSLKKNKLKIKSVEKTFSWTIGRNVGHPLFGLRWLTSVPPGHSSNLTRHEFKYIKS